MIICPNFNNPDVAREFNEIKEATSEKAAYAIWSLNNGNAIDRAPNGAPSILFQSLLDYYGGDRKLAIKAKSKVYKISFLKWFGNWTGLEGIVPEHEEKEIEEVSKVVDENGEPLVVYHGTPNKFTTFDINHFGKTDLGSFGKGFYFTAMKEKASRYGENIVPVFINARNLIDGYKQELLSFVFGSNSVEEAKERIFDTNDDAMTQEEKEYAASLITQELIDKANEYDGVDGTNTASRFSELVVGDPNQIKSATDNNEEFSTLNNNIYLHTDKRVKGTGNLLDEIQKEGATGIEAAENVVNFLKNKFPALKIHVVDDVKDIHRDNSVEENTLKGSLYSNKNVKSLVYHGEVYLIRSRLSEQGGQIASEEILHMLIKTLLDYNKDLFNSLLREARSKFKKLTAQIEDTYKEFSQDTIDNEIVTQALARYVNRDIQANRHGKFAKLVEQFVNWLKSIVIKSSEKIGNTVYIDPTQLKLLTLQEFSDLINAEDTVFDINTQSSDILYHTSSNSITKQMYDLSELINTERRNYINRVTTEYLHNNLNAKLEDISRVQNSARKSFNESKLNEIMLSQLRQIAASFNLTLNRDGYYESTEPTLNKYLLEHIVNSLSEDTFRAYNISSLKKTRYQQVGSAQNATSFANIIYNALYDGDIITLDKELARDYVRIFWGSDLILSALETIDTGNMSSEQLETKLVDRMTSVPVESRDTSIVDWFNNIWSQLRDLVKQIFGTHLFTLQQKDDILKAVDAAFMIAEDLDYTNSAQAIYDRADGNYNTSLQLSEKDREVLSSLKQGIRTRIKSQMSRSSKNEKLINKLKTALEVIDGKNEDNVEDVFDIIQDFLINANTEIGRTKLYIDRTLFRPDVTMDQWDAQLINFILQDLIGYYDNILSIIQGIFADKYSVINHYNKLRSLNGAINLENLVGQLKKDLTKLLENYNKEVVLAYVKKLCTDYVNKEDSISDKLTFIYNMCKWLEQDVTYGDLAAGEVIIGIASRSKSPIVRLVEKFASEAEYKTARQVLKKGHELMRLYDKVRPTGSQISWNNWQKRFMEFDDSGIPTGYFIREINEGLFYKRKDKKEEELREKYGLTVDEEGNTVFPQEDFKKDDSVYNKYYDELDEWLDKNCERRYTLEYYKQKRRHLSPKTLLTQQSIQRRIDLLLRDARDDKGFVDLRKLTQNERSQLDALRKQKRDLGSHYIFTEVEGGVLRVEEKQGEALIMADEISEWNTYLQGKVNYKTDWTLFNKAKQELINSGATQDEIDAFERANTVTRLTPEFYLILKKVTGSGPKNEELIKLLRRYNEIIGALKIREGAGSHNLNKLGLGLNTDQSGWKELKRIEQRMAEIRKDLKMRGITGQPGDNSNFSFDEIAANVYVTVGDGNPKTYLQYLIDTWRSANTSGTNLWNVFNDLFTFKDEKGRTRYLKAFLYLTPRKFTLNVNGETINCILSLPGSEYSELDESSLFVNDKFVKNGRSLLPKAYDKNGNRLYKNKAYEDLTNNEILFLNKLKETMQEANDMIPLKSLSREDMLPQISGRTATVWANSMMAKEYGTALKYPFRKFGVKYSETEEDVSTNMDLARRPDGTIVNNIPIRFIRKLDNPMVQSTDVLGSVIMFYDMACNYKYKSENLPTMELIKYLTTPGRINKNEGLSSQYSKIENILDQRYYGKETSFGFGSNEKITPAKLKVIQTTKTIRNWASVAMLGINFTTIEVGYIDAMFSMMCDAIGGKYLTMDDFKTAFGSCIGHTVATLRGLGKPVVDDKLVAAMLFNQLSRSNSEIFSATDKFKLDRFIKQHLLMGGYTLSDYMVNGLMLRATYNHYRLIKNPSTGKDQFMSKSDAINILTKLGYTEKQAVNQWKHAKITLWEAYDVINGDFVLKDQYKDIVTERQESRISGRLRDRTAMYNGVIPQTEKAKLQQNVFGSFLTLMRNFYVNTYWDRFKTGGDYIKEEDDHHISWYSEYARDDIKMFNFETGEDEGAVFKDFCRGVYKLISNLKHLNRNHNALSREQKYAVARCTSELAAITGLLFLMMWSVAFARTHDYDDDKEPTWTLNLIGSDKPLLDFKLNNADKKFMNFLRWKLALLSTRSFTERLTAWWLPTTTEILSNPTTAYSYLDDMGVIWGFGIDLFSQRSGEEIKTGAYKHMTRGTRDLLKLTSPLGFDNLVRQWHVDGIKSTFNFYRKMAPTDIFVPSQSEWNEQHGISNKGKKKNSSSSQKVKEISD